MAFNFGQFNEFSDSVTAADPVIEALARAIQPSPFQGVLYQAMGAPVTTLTQKAFEVYSRTKTSRDGTIDADWDNDDTTGLGVSDDSLKGLTIGHVLDIGGEVVIVASVDRDNGQIGVLARGEAGTTAAAHTSGDGFKVIGFAGNDTDLKNVTGVTEATTKWTNYVQTVFEVIDWTKHAELVRKGLSPAQATQVLIQEAELRVAEMLSRMAIWGLKKQATNGSTRYMSAGLLQQLGDTTNRGARKYNVNGVLTEAAFMAAIKGMIDAGGDADTILCGTTAKPWINAFLGADASTVFTDTNGNHIAGGRYVESYNYEGKIFNVKVDLDMPSDRIAIVKLGDCKKGWLADDGLRLVDEPQASSREFRKSLQGSVGFLVENVGVNHTLLYGVTGGSDERVHQVSFAQPVVTTADQITVHADANVPAAAAGNYGKRVLIGTAWTSGTKIATAVVGEVYASNGSAWIKQ